MTFTEQDQQQLSHRGISEAQANAQLQHFQQGFPFLKLKAAAAIGKGIMQLHGAAMEIYLSQWQDYCAGQHDIVKFVPASGAASRMFKTLFAFLSASYVQPQTSDEQKFFAQIKQFAFYDALNAVCIKNEGQDIDALMAAGKYKAIIENLLLNKGLNYGTLPKGLLQFHRYADGARTPLAEHLVEAAQYAACGKRAKIHFTVSHQHRDLFQKEAEQAAHQFGEQLGMHYDISFSEQSLATDTLAVQLDNTPFRTADGKLFFRPGGHGALLENLQALAADIVFIKNIDNVVPDRLKAPTTLYKQLLAGYLVTQQQQAFTYLRELDKGVPTRPELLEMLRFVEQILCCQKEGVANLDDKALAHYLHEKLNRPMRVCGMVRNVGEPGGGPFLCYNADGSVSLQILERTQIDDNNPEAVAMFQQGTHFNPVDLVCALRDYQGRPFDLHQYVDAKTGFISHKSKDGRELKALELPGLWNGAMSQWNTMFVEVPLETFNPVKTVNDLLRKEHQ